MNNRRSDFSRQYPDAEGIAKTLGVHKKIGKGRFVACCPTHADGTPSLSICDGERGLIFNCFAGCDFRDVRDALAARGLIPKFVPKRRA